MRLVDTHCHIQSIGGTQADLTAKKWRESGVTDPDKVIGDAGAAGVASLICVGTDLADSQAALEFASQRDGVFAAVGVHPHEARQFLRHPTAKGEFPRTVLGNLGNESKLIAIGEIGLDYYYQHSPRAQQKELLEFQLNLAQQADLPVIFHVREAFEDFWPMVDRYPGVRGVIHSFSATTTELEQILKRDFYVGLNGIMTFTKDQAQLEAAKAVPLDKLVLETDAPYLTPVPHRGAVCQPKHVKATANFLAELRDESPAQLARATSHNASHLFGL